MKYVDYYIAKNTKNNQVINFKFVVWINQIEKYFIDKYCINLLDLPDEDYMFYFDENYSHKEVIDIIINNNYLPCVI
jgi:hypothetical protein